MNYDFEEMAESLAQRAIEGPYETFSDVMSDSIYGKSGDLCTELDQYIHQLCKAKDIHEAGAIALQLKGMVTANFEAHFLEKVKKPAEKDFDETGPSYTSRELDNFAAGAAANHEAYMTRDRG